MAKKPEKGTRDPFRKWSGTTEAFASINTPLAAAKDLLSDLNRQMASPGLGRQGRVVLAKEIARAKADVARLEKEAKGVLKTMHDQQKMQLDIIYKLNALRTQVSRKDLDPEVTKLLAQNEKRLEQLLLRTRNVDLESIGELLKEIHESQKSIEELPEELVDALSSNDVVLEKILERQEEARAFLQEQKDSFKKFRNDIKKDIVSFGVRVADKIGVGPLTLGNVGRAVRGAYRGAKYGLKTIKAIRDSRLDPQKEAEGVGRQSIADKFFEYVNSTRLFQKWVMRSGDKKDAANKSLFSFLPSLKGLLGGLGKFFGAGGVIGSLIATLGGALGKKVLPMLGGLLRGGMRVLGPLGAVASAFAGGHWLGTKIYDMFSEPIGKAVDYFFLKNPETGKTGLQESFEAAMNKGQEIYKNTTEAIKAGKDKVVNAVSSAWTGVKDFAGTAIDAGRSAVNTGIDTAKAAGSAAVGAVTSGAAAVGSAAMSTAGKVGDTVAAGAASVGSAATGLVTRGVEAVAGGGSKVKDWIGKIFSAGGNVDVDGLNPAMQKNMVSMAQEYYEKTGKKLQLNSAYRSPEKQAELYRRLPKGRAAPPGRSLHEYGFAFDTQSTQGEELAKMGLLSKYGFDRPIKSEPWHVQPKGMNITAAKAGLYSADSPVHEGGQANATPVAQTVTPTEPSIRNQPIPSGVPAGSQTHASGGSKTIQPSSRISVSDIPSYDMSDGHFLAANLGLAA